MNSVLFRQADIPVQKISGFAKGYGISPENPFTVDTKINHAWNAVFIQDNWFLLDCTWGSGQVGFDLNYKAEFREFYFLTEPECLVVSHFPYSRDNPEEMMKWQLLQEPISLETFNKLLHIQPEAYNIGLQPASHRDAILKFDDEIELKFKEDRPRTIHILAKLYKEEMGKAQEQDYCCYRYWSNGYVRVKVMPQESGVYKLQIFGAEGPTGGNKHMSLVFDYIIHCNQIPHGKASKKCSFPHSYWSAFVNECQVLEPLGKQIPPETAVKMRFQSPLLKRMMINKEMLRKKGDIFEATMKSPKSGNIIIVYGSRSDSGSLDALYEFAVA